MIYLLTLGIIIFILCKYDLLKLINMKNIQKNLTPIIISLLIIGVLYKKHTEPIVEGLFLDHELHDFGYHEKVTSKKVDQLKNEINRKKNRLSKNQKDNLKDNISDQFSSWLQNHNYEITLNNSIFLMNRFLDTHTPPDNLRHELTEKEKNTLMIEVHEDEIRVISDYLIKNPEMLKSLGIENIEPFSWDDAVEIVAEHPIISVVVVSIIVVITAGAGGAVIGAAIGAEGAASSGVAAAAMAGAAEGWQIGSAIGFMAAESAIGGEIADSAIR
jgi:hypothetical protein